ncbi:MAG: hypothetical protein AAGI03_04875 [Pseudomonadota bacterium]
MDDEDGSPFTDANNDPLLQAVGQFHTNVPFVILIAEAAFPRRQGGDPASLPRHGDLAVWAATEPMLDGHAWKPAVN